MQQYFSFNESIGREIVIQGHEAPETEDAQAVLREPIPLKDTWVLHEQAKSNRYSTKRIVTFSTAQEFWEVWNGVPQPRVLLEGKKFMRVNTLNDQPPTIIDAIMIFRQGIEPEWEHETNANGGHFQLLLLRSGTVGGGGQIDEYWNNLVLGMVGETFVSSEMITGVRLVDKLNGTGKGTDGIRVELWYHSEATSTDVNNLRKSMEAILTTRLDGTSGPPLAMQETRWRR
jgi:translation initiation factor 4E